MTGRAPTPPDSRPTRPPLDSHTREFWGPWWTQVGPLVAYARHLEGQVEKLRQDANTMRDNMNRQAIELGKANARATDYLAELHRSGERKDP